MRDVHLRFSIDRSTCQRSHLSLVFCECLQIIIHKGDTGLAYEISPILSESPLWALGPARASPGHRSRAEAALDATAAAALCAGGADGAAPASGPRAPPRGVWDPGGRRAGAGGLWLADPDGLCRAAQPGHPATGGGSRASGHHAVPGGGRCAAATGAV